MKKIFYSLFMAVASVAFISCSSNDPEPDPNPTPGPGEDDPIEIPADAINSFYVLNRGSNTKDSQVDGTLSYYTYSPSEGKLLSTALTAFKDVNDYSLGNNPNAMAVYDKYLWVVINESNRIEVIDMETKKSVKQISFSEEKYGSPRQIWIDEDKAYITFVSDNTENSAAGGYIAQYNCKTYEMIQYFPVGSKANKPDGIVVVGEYVYCADNYGIKIEDGFEDGNLVVRWLKNSDWTSANNGLEQIIIKGGLTPTDIVTNGTEVFVICSGVDASNTRKKNSTVYKITGYEGNAFCEGTLMKVDKKYLYVINAPKNAVTPITYKRYSVIDNNDVTNMLAEGEGVDYPTSLAIDEWTGDIIIGSATKVGGYVSETTNGYFNLYSSDGKKLLKGETGIDPFDILFRPVK
ncbi:MAG: hypothetical protein K2K27_04695 [Muribaculaceae bacterium]|nr:hypothetical protein [Muribaculaceae bacterium]MDE7092194.1 hypothetical protein [Muribaculaceae bacterium]